MTGSKINRANRYAAIVVLSNLNTLLVHIHGGLFRMVKADCKDAFTDKEKDFILKRNNIIEQCQRDLTALMHQMRARYNQNV